MYDISYTEATRDIAHFKEAPVRWGGVIVDVENEQKFSFIQVLYYPLNNYGRPQLDQPNKGRFLVKSPEFLDPAVYKKDKEITVSGTIKGDIERTIGNKTLRLPLISAQVMHLWPAYLPVNYYAYPYYGYYGYYPYYWGGYYWPYRY